MSELTTTGKNEVTAFDDNAFADLAPEQSVAREIVIPKILIMQNGSPRVAEGENVAGQLVDTMNWEVLGNAAGKNSEAMPLEFVPFHWTKLWINKYNDGKQWRLDSIDTIDHSNESLNPFEEWQGTNKEGKKCTMKRVFMHLFYILIPGKPMPYTLGFRGSSKKAGDSLVTQMFVANKMLKSAENYKRSPMGAVISVVPVRKTKDGNTYIELEVKKLRESTKEEAVQALNWFNTINSGKARADHSDLEEEHNSNSATKTGHVPDDIEF